MKRRFSSYKFPSPLIEFLLGLWMPVECRWVGLVALIFFFTGASPSPAQNEADSAALTAFLLHDLEFTLLSAPSPGGDPERVQQWANATHERIHTLELVALRYRLDARVIQSMTTVKRFLDDYRDFVGDLRSIGYVHDMTTTQGDASPAKALSRTYSIISGGAFFWVSAIEESADYWDEKLVRASFETKVEKRKQGEVLARVEQASDDFQRCVKDLSMYSAELPVTLQVVVPPIMRQPDFAEKGPQVTGKLFSTVADARRVAGFDRIAAAGLFLKAAADVPDFGDGSRLDFNQLYRAPYAYSAASLLEFEARLNPAQALELSRRSVQAFDQGDAYPVQEVADVPYPFRVAKARALARSGDRERAAQSVAELGARFAEEPVTQAIQHYDLAVIHALLGQDDLSLGHMEASYQAKPRRDPYALRDPLLASLVQRRGLEVEALADHPLVGGKWDDGKNSAYIFDPDGSLWQRRTGIEYTGLWNAEGDQLTLHGRSKELADGQGTFEVSPERDRLRITANGYTHEFVRSNRSAVENLEIQGRILQGDGSWGWADETLSPPHFARYHVFRSPDTKKREFWFVHEDPLLSRIDEIIPE